MIGRSLRHYVITASLGQGGMGVVWKARDTVLEREVALKVLPLQYIDDRARTVLLHAVAISDAVTAWDDARRVTPDNVIVLRNLAAAYYFLGRYDEAASSLQRALEVRPSAAAYTNLGTIRFFQGRHTDAVAAFEKAVELSANSHLYWANLGDGYRWAPGRRADAPAAYRRASELIKEPIAHKPEDADLRTRHGRYLIKMGNTDAALTEIQAVTGRPDLSAQMRYRLTVIYELAGQREQSLAALDGALNSGYPINELQREPELLQLRNDARYHRLIDRHGRAQKD